MIEVKLKIIKDAKIPQFMTEGAAALDCFVRSVEYIQSPGAPMRVKFNLGFAMEIPKGYCAKIWPHSSVCETALRLSNCVGIICSDHKGEVSAVFDIIDELGLMYKEGDACCQLTIEKVEKALFVLTDELSETKRGCNGYGHTENF